MKFCYLILAQRFPKQLGKLIKAIYSNDSFIYIHLDADENIEEFTKGIAKRPNLFFIENRIKCIWGHRSLIDAELLLLNATKGLAKYYVLLSDQHYPLKPTSSLWEYLEYNHLAGIVDQYTPGNVQAYNKRISYLTIFYGKKREEYVRLPSLNMFSFYKPSTFLRVIKIIQKGKVRKLKLLIRIPKIPITIKWGSQWWILRNDAAEEVLTWNIENTDFYQSTEYKFIVDEFFFQSIINHLDLKNIQFKPASFVFRNPNPPHEFPKLFKSEDINLFTGLPDYIFFARKFDYEKFPEIVDRLEMEIQARSAKIK